MVYPPQTDAVMIDKEALIASNGINRQIQRLELKSMGYQAADNSRDCNRRVIFSKIRVVGWAR
jgi:hypothetical protein